MCEACALLSLYADCPVMRQHLYAIEMKSNCPEKEPIAGVGVVPCLD